MREKIEIPAIRDSHLRPLLDKYNLSLKLDNHEVTCSSCQRPLEWDDIGALMTKDGSLAFYCDLPLCLELASIKAA